MLRIRCRICEAELAGYEFTASGGGPLAFPMSKAIEAVLEELTEEYDGSEEWFQCRYLDGYPCFECGTVELSVVEPALMLKLDGQEWARSAAACPVCKVACRGPRNIDCEGSPGQLLAHLGNNFGAPIPGRLCQRCWRVWLSLEPDDTEGRRELAHRFADGGVCSCCRQGRLRETHFDAPHAGVVHLGHPCVAGATRKLEWDESQLRAAICDSCGEASVRLANHESKAERR